MNEKKQMSYVELTDKERKYVDENGSLLLAKTIDEPLFYYSEQLDGRVLLTWVNNTIIGHNGYGPMFCFSCKKLYPTRETHCQCKPRFHHWPNTEDEAKYLLSLKSLCEQYTESKL